MRKAKAHCHIRRCAVISSDKTTVKSSLNIVCRFLELVKQRVMKPIIPQALMGKNELSSSVNSWLLQKLRPKWCYSRGLAYIEILKSYQVLVPADFSLKLSPRWIHVLIQKINCLLKNSFCEQVIQPCNARIKTSLKDTQ